MKRWRSEGAGVRFGEKAWWRKGEGGEDGGGGGGGVITGSAGSKVHASHRSEQAAQGGRADHLGTLPTRGPAMPRHSLEEKSRIALSVKIFFQTAPIEASNFSISW